MPRTLPASLGTVAAAALLLTGCAPADGAAGSDAGGSGADDGAVEVLASFYPLQYVVEQVGGDLVDVASLTPPGTEPHDVELSPRQVRRLSSTDLVVYLSGFQSAIDDAIEVRRPERVVDAAGVVELVAPNPDQVDADEAASEEADVLDPHFWLDPQRLGALAGPVADALAEIDPDNAAVFAEAADRLVADLDALDREFETGLATCERRVVVTSHDAFGYLTRTYGLEEVGIAGLEPDAEPSPARLREIGDVVREHGVTTIFTEVLVSPKAAETLADDLGVRTAVLDPVENLTEGMADYRAAMEQNLATLRAGLDCA